MSSRSIPNSSAGPVPVFELSMYGLRSATPGVLPPGLVRTRLRCRLDGPLLTSTLRRHYRVESGNGQEVVYAFALAPDELLLGIAVELNGRLRTGQIWKRPVAEPTLLDTPPLHDSTVPVETYAGGWHAIALGLVARGDRVTIQTTVHRELRLHDGALRVGFTSDGRDASPIAAELTIAAPLGDADVTVTPAVESTVDGGSRERTFRWQFPTDSASTVDVVARVQGLPPCVAVLGTDRTSATHAAVALTQWQLPADAPVGDLGLQVVISGAGLFHAHGVRVARSAVERLVSLLRPRDRVGVVAPSALDPDLMPFGPTSQCDWSALARRFSRLVEHSPGTYAGLAKAVDFWGEPTGGLPPDLLLLAVGDEPGITREAFERLRRDGRRVFCIALGAQLNRDALEAAINLTGGVLECVADGPGAARAAEHLIEGVIERMRALTAGCFRVTWDDTLSEDEVELGEPGPGRTLRVLSKLPQPSAKEARLEFLHPRLGPIVLGKRQLAPVEDTDAPARLLAIAKWARQTTEQQQAAALVYQLPHPTTTWVVCRPVDFEPRPEPLVRHRVPLLDIQGHDALALVNAIRAGRASPTAQLPNAGAIRPRSTTPTRQELAVAVLSALEFGGSVEEHLPDSCPQPIREAQQEVAGMGLSDGEAWLMVAAWLATREEGQGGGVNVPESLVLQLHAIDRRRAQRALAAVAQRLGGL